MRSRSKGPHARTVFVVTVSQLIACGSSEVPTAPPGEPMVPASSAATASPTTPLPLASSGPVDVKSEKAMPPTFDDDLAFLQKHGDVLVLDTPSGGRVALSAKYQGRVMTSSVGPGGKSLGFVFRSFIESEKTGTQFDNYGGEDRFWLGPEGGQYGLYFKPGKPFDFSEWQTPDALQTGAWTVREQAADHVVFARSMKVTNYAGTELDLDVERTVRVLTEKDVSAKLGVSAAPGLQWVAFETVNKVTNTGKKAWTKTNGLPSVWILAMYNPSPDTFVTIPFDRHGAGEVVNDRYFGKVPSDRLSVDAEKGVVLFACDANHRSKIGIGPNHVKGALGSYSATSKLLTVVSFDRPKGAHDYVNSMWEKQKDPFGGDVVNSYNDGPTEPGKPSLGGFYEIETSSPALALSPGASAIHIQRTYHFVGEAPLLDPIAQKTLGVTTAQIAKGIR